MAFRPLVGSLATLTTSVVNLTVLMALRGEPGWICLTCCNADILFCVLVLHWATSPDASAYTAHASLTLDSGVSKRAPSPRPSMAIVPPAFSSLEYPHLDTIAHALESLHNDPSIWPYEHDPTSPTSPVPAKLPGSVTTEIRSHAAAPRSKSRSGRLRKSRDGSGSECDWGELREIRVQREVCIDRDSCAESDGERGMGSISVEEMV